MGCQGSKSTKPGVPEKHGALASSPSESSKKTLLGSEGTKNPVGETAVLSPCPQPSETHTSAYPSVGMYANMVPMYANTIPRNQQRTLCTERNEIHVMVTKFSCHNSTVGNAIGRNSKEIRWMVGFDRNASPLDIKLHIQEHKLHDTGVRIEVNGQPIFTGAGEMKSTMTEDFRYQWPLRATIRGLSERNFFEIRLHQSSDLWFPATITRQREDGYFEVTMQQSNHYGEIREERCPAVDRANLREALTGKPLIVPEDALILEVPKQDPSQAVLKMASGKPITRHFGRASPPLNAQASELCLRVNKDRSLVTANVGHSVLSRYVSGEVQSVRSDVERLRRKWTFQLGPFAEHTVEISKNFTLGQIITLLVDGEVLIECTPAEIGCNGPEWQCTFQLVGEHVTDFEVFKTNKDGTPLDSTDHVKAKRSYMHECKVVLPNDWDLSSAKLLVDGNCFSDLTVKAPEREEQALSMDSIAFQHTYGIAVPYKIDHTAPSDLMAFTENLVVKAHASKDIVECIGSQLWQKCTASSVTKDDVVVHQPGKI